LASRKLLNKAIIVSSTSTSPLSWISEPTLSVVPSDATDILGIIKRGWFIIATFLLLGLAAGLALTILMPPSYRSNVRLVLENSVNKYLQTNQVVDGPTLGDDSWSQIHIISSEAVVLPVIKKLNLTQDPEFGSIPSDSKIISYYSVRDNIRQLAEYLGLRAKKVTNSESPEMMAYRSVTERLMVTWESQPQVINVSFVSKDPVKAALIANEIASSYIDSTVESKRGSAHFAAQALQARLDELRTMAAQAEHQLLDYKLANNIRDTNQKADSADLATNSADISNARSAMVDARARMEVAKLADQSDNGTSYVPDSAFISRLREQYADITTRAHDMANRVGEGHAATRQLRKQQTEIVAAIAAEQQRIAETYSLDYDLAKARFNELNAPTLPGMTDGSKNSAAVSQVRELESNAQTLRSLYNSMLLRVSDENRVEKDRVVLPDARILAHAAVPQQTESAKKRLMVLFGSPLFGLLLGTAILFGHSNPIGVFRTPHQIRTALGLKPIAAPVVKLRNWRRSKSLKYYAIQAPHSRFAQAFHMIWAQLRTGRRDNLAKVVGVVSSVAGEGKTTIAINLASFVAKNAGVRILLIDADFHRRSITRALAPKATQGLKEALEDPDQLQACIAKGQPFGFDIMPCPVSERIANAAELLGSSNMEVVISRVRDSYDLVIVDVPPAAEAADFGMVSPMCDGFVYVVEWSATSQQVVLDTFKEMGGLWERVACVVLNKVDPAALRSIEYSRGKRHSPKFA